MKQINSYSISLEGVTELLTFEGRIVFVKIIPFKNSLGIRLFIESDTDAEQIKRAFSVISTGESYNGNYVATVYGLDLCPQINHIIELPLSVSQSQDGEVSAKAENVSGCVKQHSDFNPVEYSFDENKFQYVKRNHLSAAQAKNRFDTMRKAIEP